MVAELLPAFFLLAFSVLFALNLNKPTYTLSLGLEQFQDLAPVLDPSKQEEDAPQTLSQEPQCGIGLGGCPEGAKCMNGYCKSTTKPKLGKTDLPVVP